MKKDVLKYLFSIPFTQIIKTITYAETEIADSVLIKLKTCFSVKFKVYKSNVSNTHIC